MRRSLPLLALCLASGAPAFAALSPADLAGAGATPPPGAVLPAGLRFIDQQGRPVILRAGPTPTLLLFADYSCAHLCGPGLTLTAGALHDAGLRAPRDYRLVVIGMDEDGPVRARAFAAAHLGALPEVRASAMLLTGDRATVARAEQALGYHAVYDRDVDQFAHDATSFVFTPDGALSRLLPETAVTPAMMAGAVRAAARGERAVPQPTLGQQVALLCYGFAAAHGVHGRAVVLLLRLAALATVGAMVAAVWRLSRRRRAAA